MSMADTSPSQSTGPPSLSTDLPTRPAGIKRNNSSFSSFMSLRSLDRYGDEWGSDALTLLDVAETFFDSRLDLINRRLKAQSARLKSRAVELLPRGLRTPAGGGILLVEDDDIDDVDTATTRSRGDKYRKEVEKEVERIKIKLAAKVTHLSSTWQTAQIVRTRDKVSFLFGVLSLTFTCLLYGLAPEWIPFAYTAQSAFYLPLRIFTYKRKGYHYFLFGTLCYFVNILDLLWLWVFPSSTSFFICAYLLTMGPLASAIITWRNSLVFHSLDKVTSLFIHMYPPVTFTIILHVYPNAQERYPGIAHVSGYSWWSMIFIAAVPYILWQAAYYKFISVDRRTKIESGQRENSFHYMLNDKRAPIGRALQGIRPEHREPWFIFGQLIYSIVFMIPPATLFIHGPKSSAVFLVTIFTVSAWNGATFYVEVFGRKFERELERLRKEMELASASGTSLSSSSIPTTSTPSTPFVDPTTPSGTSTAGEQTNGEGNSLGLDASPLILPGRDEPAPDMEVPEMTLEKAAKGLDRPRVVESKKTV